MTKRLQALFLDRDGTLIHDKHYLADPAGVELLPGVGEALQSCVERGLRLFVVSNQSGVGRGFFTEDAVQRCNARLAELLIPYGVSFTAIYFCPHAPEAACDCRKPDIGMWLRARTEFNLDPATCGMIGDKSEDMAFGAAAGFALRILTLTGKGRKTAEALGVHVGPFPLVRKDAWGQIPHVVIEDFNLLMRGIDLWSA
jgi:D-glycero-D-manno-heptose 1,7-bisphosphate phosphatase